MPSFMEILSRGLPFALKKRALPIQYSTYPLLIAGTLITSPAPASEQGHDQVDILETIVVTATREEARLADTAASIGVLNEDDIKAISPTHPEQLLNRIPGVNIVQIGSSGEGHMAAIRQPISTTPVYLFLENGVPVRSPAFFNHNSLYEVNVAGSQGIEVTKGPGSALYGSDAIGGVVNVLSGPFSGEDNATVGLEAGSDDWKRATLDGNTSKNGHDFNYNLSLSDNGGWRDNTESDKVTFSSGWGSDLSDSVSHHTLLTFSRINMNTGGSGLRYDDFKDNPSQAGNLIGFRDVEALGACRS